MKRSKKLLLVMISLLSLSLCVLLSLAFGARFISFNEVLDTLIHSRMTTINEIVVHERIPRTVFGIIAGSALGVSGALMQAITRNPIAIQVS